MNIWKSTKVYTAILFLGQAFWKENIEDSQSKLTCIGLRHFKLLSKDDISENLALKFPSESGAKKNCPSLQVYPRPTGNCTFGTYYLLPYLP